MVQRITRNETCDNRKKVWLQDGEARESEQLFMEECKKDGRKEVKEQI
jgi:hypothetical protein